MSTEPPSLAIDALERDPYPAYRWLQQHEPVAFSADLQLHLVTRWDDVRRVARDVAVFSAAVTDSPLSAVVGKNLLHSDGTYHRQLRNAMSGIMGADARQQHSSLARTTAAILIDRLRRRTSVDLMAEFALPLAAITMQRLIGLHPDTVERMGEWFRGLATGAANFEATEAKEHTGRRAAAEIDDAVAAAITSAQSQSLVGCLRDATPPRRTQEISAAAKLFIIGGVQEPRDLLGITLVALLTNAIDIEALRHDRPLRMNAIDEAARWVAPVGTVTREVAVDGVQLHGVALPKGSRVAGVIAAANRDPSRWSNPDRYDLHRDEGGHIAFGFGAHTCIGAQLARVMVDVALDALIGNFDFDLDEDVVLTGYEFRGPQSVQVRLRARES